MKAIIEHKIERNDLPYNDEIIKVALYSIYKRILNSLKIPFNGTIRNYYARLDVEPSRRGEIQIKQLLLSIQTVLLDYSKKDERLSSIISILHGNIEPAILIANSKLFVMFYRNGRSLDISIELLGYDDLIEECFNRVKTVDKVVVPDSVNKYFEKGLLLDHFDILDSCHKNIMVVFQR